MFDGLRGVQPIDPVLILRFLGTSPDSSSIGPLLISVCEQIGRELLQSNE